MDVFDIIEKLGQCSKGEIQFALMQMMMAGKINYQDFNEAYIKVMQNIVKDSESKVQEANMCVCESFFYKKTRDKNKKSDYNHTQRCLYLMDKSRQFNDSDLKEKYGYDEEYAKTMSWYERSKKEDRI